MCLRKQELEIQLEDPPEQVRIGETPPTPLEPTESPKHKQEFSSRSAQKETGAPGMCSGVCSTQLDEALTMSIWRGVLWSGNPPPHFLLPPLFLPEQLNPQASGQSWLPGEGTHPVLRPLHFLPLRTGSLDGRQGVSGRLWLPS